MNAYIKRTLEDVHNEIQNCPCDSPATIKILNILEKLNNAVITLAQEVSK